jgi:hypothetical protein
MPRRKLSSNDYLLASAFFGVLIIAMSNGLYEDYARIIGTVVGLAIVLLALGLGMRQNRENTP